MKLKSLRRRNKVFTLQSIKSRIETIITICRITKSRRFLLYSPLNQGLKHTAKPNCLHRRNAFLLYSPLNQGLKRNYRQK